MDKASEAPSKEYSAVSEIERLGYQWREVSQFDLSQLSAERRVQVREPKHYAPKESVGRFAVMMKESAFPPIIVTEDEWIVDGNTRIGAAELIERKHFPALVLNVEYAGERTTEKQKHELNVLAATLNSQNGVPLTAKETRAAAQHMIALGWKTEQIARAIGIKPVTVSAIKRELDASDKMRLVGLDPNGDLKGASLRALGNKNVLVLNNAPFRKLAELAADAGLNASEVMQAAKEARSMGSEAEQVARLEQIRTENHDRIQERKLTGHGRPPVSRQLRQALGGVTKFEGREQELIETDPNVHDTHVEVLVRSVAVLSKVLELQGPVKE